MSNHSTGISPQHYARIGGVLYLIIIVAGIFGAVIGIVGGLLGATFGIAVAFGMLALPVLVVAAMVIGVMKLVAAA